MFEQAFKNIDDILHKDAGASSELDYVEQTSWILFLKYLDDLEEDRKTEAALAGKGSYTYIIAEKFRWESWAAPKGEDGKLDHNVALSGDDLKDFVNQELFPYLRKFKNEAENPDTIEYKIGEIFSELKNKIQSGYTLREVLNIVDDMRFHSQEEKHELSHLYEGKIKNMGNAGRNGGEYYTPRPLIKTIVKVVAPKIGDKIYDGAVGSAGFLVEAFEYLKKSKELSTQDIETLQKKTFYGKEKKSLAYIIGIMNMVLHGIEAPNIIHTNTLSENLSDIQEKDRFDIILANPPFGGKERKEVQQNFPIKTGETAFLFLQHFIKSLKADGKAGVIIKNTFLSNPDNAAISLRKLLLENCSLHTILDLPRGAFTGTGEKTVVLFFDKGVPTKSIWYYQLNLERNLGKTNPLNEKDLEEFVDFQKNKTNSENSWSLDVQAINSKNFNLSAKNPNKKKKTLLRLPKDILIENQDLTRKSSEILDQMLKNIFKNNNSWDEKKLGEIMKLEYGKPLVKDERDDEGKYPVYGANGIKSRSNKFYFDKDSIVVGRKGSAGELNLVKGKFWPLDVTYYVTFDKSRYNLKFLYYILLTLNLPKLAKGVKPGINRNDVYALTVKVPSLEEQESIVKSLDVLFKDVEELESLYEKKIDNLGEIKKSILNNVFS